jgi:hypothetical protein
MMLSLAVGQCVSKQACKPLPVMSIGWVFLGLHQTFLLGFIFCVSCKLQESLAPVGDVCVPITVCFSMQ